MLLPGIKVNTSPTDHIPVDQMQFMRFTGKTWELWRAADGELSALAPERRSQNPAVNSQDLKIF